MNKHWSLHYEAQVTMGFEDYSFLLRTAEWIPLHCSHLNGSVLCTHLVMLFVCFPPLFSIVWISLCLDLSMGPTLLIQLDCRYSWLAPSYVASWITLDIKFLSVFWFQSNISVCGRIVTLICLPCLQDQYLFVLIKASDTSDVAHVSFSS